MFVYFNKKHTAQDMERISFHFKDIVLQQSDIRNYVVFVPCRERVAQNSPIPTSTPIRHKLQNKQRLAPLVRRIDR